MLLRYERDSASIGNSASLLINISVAKPSVLLIHNAEVQGEPMTWGVQYVVVTQDETMILRHYHLNQGSKMRLSSEEIDQYFP